MSAPQEPTEAPGLRRVVYIHVVRSWTQENLAALIGKLKEAQAEGLPLLIDADSVEDVLDILVPGPK